MIIENPKYISRLFYLCWIVYVTAYLGRLNYSAAMTEIISEGYIPMEQAGLVLTGFFIAYGIGMLINGIICDKVSAKNMLLVGFAASIGANILMGVFTFPRAMLLIWWANGFAQSMIWPPVVKLISGYLSRMQSTKTMVNMSTTVAAGTLLTYALTAGIIAFFPWQRVFFLAAAAMAAAAVLWYWGINAIEKHAKEYGRPVHKDTAESGPGGQSFLGLIWVSGLILAGFAAVMLGMLRDGITSWTPVLIDARFNLGSSLSVLITGFVPLVSILMVYVAYLLNRKTKNEILTAACLFGVSALFLVILAAGGINNIFVLVVAIVMATAVMHGTNAMFVSLVPMYFAKMGKSATVTGTMNSFINLGSGISSFGAGIITVGHGWGAVILSWFMIALLGGAACLLCAKKWNSFKESLS